MTLYVFGPAGAGKTHFIRALRKMEPALDISKSTQPPPEGYGVDGSKSVQLLLAEEGLMNVPEEPPPSDFLMWVGGPAVVGRTEAYWDAKARVMAEWLRE